LGSQRRNDKLRREKTCTAAKFGFPRHNGPNPADSDEEFRPRRVGGPAQQARLPKHGRLQSTALVAKLGNGDGLAADSANAHIAVPLKVRDDEVADCQALELATPPRTSASRKKPVLAAICPGPSWTLANVHEVETSVRVETWELLMEAVRWAKRVTSGPGDLVGQDRAEGLDEGGLNEECV
jgi:hypothetical protein